MNTLLACQPILPFTAVGQHDGLEGAERLPQEVEEAGWRTRQRD